MISASVFNSTNVDRWSGMPGLPWYKPDWENAMDNLVNDVQVSRSVPHSHPWIVNVQYEHAVEPSRCSGVLIPNRKWSDRSDSVLTAAHCVCK